MGRRAIASAERRRRRCAVCNRQRVHTGAIRMSDLGDPGLAWAALTTSALRGTERAAGGALTLPESLAALCKSDADAAAQLLRATALLAPILLAGRIPNRSTTPLP